VVALRRGVLALALLLVILMTLTGCGGGTGAASDGGDRLNVVATTSVLADIAQHVAGDRFTVETLLPAGTDPHAFEPSADDLRRLQTADLVIVNGGGLEGTLDRYLGDVEASRLVVASKGLDASGGAEEPAVDGSGEADHADEDPHFWLDPLLARTYVRNVCAAFAQADAAQAAQFRSNAAAYEAELAALDRWIEERTATVPTDRRKLVTNHDSQAYWADRYGFEVIGTIIPSVSTGAAPTARHLADLERAIRRDRIAAVFVEVGESAGLARQVADDTGVKLVDDLYTHSLGEPGSGATTYLEMMRHNTERIVEALR